MGQHPTMLVIGLDGASWNLIDDWIEAEDLPTFKRLKERSCWGPLESSIPPITCPAWRCYSTGKNPGRLGVFWWQHIDVEKRQVSFPNSRSFKSRDLWDYLNDAGIRTGIVGMPGTFPPSPVDGFLVAGGPEAHSKGYAYPNSLEHTLNAEGYKVHPPISGPLQAGSPLIRDILKVIRMRFQTARRLLAQEPVTFLQVTTFYLNMLQHYFYRDEPVKRAWQLIDGELAQMVNDFDYVAVLSDHGTAPMKRTFFISAWLQREGYLYYEDEHRVADLLFKLGINRTAALSLLGRLGLAGFLSRFDSLIHFARRYIPDEEGVVSEAGGFLASGSEEGSLDGVDWKRTRVIASPQGPLYINREALTGEEEYEALRSELIEKLESLQDEETGEKPLARVYRREELYSGPYVTQAPDLVALDAEAYHNRGGMGRHILFGSSNWKGNNALHGLFMIGGPGIQEGKRVSGARIYDLAPTMLRLMGCRPADDMDGRVLQEIFE